jgi:hypothetical protein
VPGTSATKLGKAEDAASASGDTLVSVGAVRTDSNDTAQTSASGDYSAPTCNDMGNLKVQVEPSRKQTFMCTTTPVVPVAATTDIAELYWGSKTIKILKVIVSYQATAAGTADCYLIKRGTTTQNSGGTSATPTICPLDSNNSAATAVVKSYTGNPSLGTTLANVTMQTITSGGISAGVPFNGTYTIFDESTMGGPIVLRASKEGLVVNFNGVIPGGTSPKIATTYIWTEE